MHTNLTISIVNFKSEVNLEKCLQSIMRHPPPCKYEILIFDNDEIPILNLESYKNVKVSSFSQNHGFGYGHNYNASISKYNYMLILNPDTQITSNDFWSILKYLNKLPNVGVVAPRVRNKNQYELTTSKIPTPLCSIIYSTFLGKWFLFRKFTSRYWNWARKINSNIWEVEFVSGVCFFIKKDFFSELGGFDTTFFLYYEDVDLSLRIKKLRRKSYLIRNAEILHTKHGSTIKEKERNKLFTTSRAIFYYKHYSALSSFISLAIITTLENIAYAKHLALRHYKK